jgi:hypothetical protein
MEVIVFAVCLFGGIGVFVCVLSAVLEGPWWRARPLPGQYWDLRGIGPVRVTGTNYGIAFTTPLGEPIQSDDKAFRWQATLTTREAFEVAVARERVLKGGAP